MEASERLQRELEDLRVRERELQHRITHLREQLAQTQQLAEEASAAVTTASELERTLGRWVQRVAMILQSERAVILLHDSETDELVAQKPAVGFHESQLQAFRLKATEGVGGQVFSMGQAQAVSDALRDPRTQKRLVDLLQVRNFLCVPLVVQRRDEYQRVVETSIIGIVYAFDKRFGEDFNEEDLRLLRILARQAAAIISSAKLYLQIAEEKRQLEATVHSMLAGVIYVNRAGRVVVINQAAQRLFGVPSDDGAGKHYEEIIVNEEVREVFATSLAEARDVSAEISFFLPQERIFQTQTALVRDEKGEVLGAVAIFNDITEIRNVERMKTAFVSTVSHELRTPLTSIKGFISTLLEDKDNYFDRETQREFFEIIDSECDRLTRLISALLNVSRIEAGRA